MKVLRRSSAPILCFLLVLAAVSALHAQKKGSAQEPLGESKKMIDLIEIAVQNDEIGNLASALASEVALNIRGGESGLFSKNQAIVIIRSHFSARVVLQFKFSTKQFNQEPFYATGGGIFSSKGRRERFQIYAGLTIKEGRIVISQFNIY